MLASITSLLVNRHADDRLSRQKETDFVIFEQHESFSFKNFTPPPHFLVKHYLSIFTYDLPHCSFLCLIILVTDFERGIPFLFMYKKTPMRKTGISQSISSKHNKFFLESSDFLCFNKENLIQQSPSDGYRIKQIYILSFSLKKTSLSASLGFYILYASGPLISPLSWTEKVSKRKEIVTSLSSEVKLLPSSSRKRL